MKILYGVGAAMAELFYPPGTNKFFMVDQNGNWVDTSISYAVLAECMKGFGSCLAYCYDLKCRN